MLNDRKDIYLNEPHDNVRLIKATEMPVVSAAMYFLSIR